MPDKILIESTESDAQVASLAYLLVEHAHIGSSLNQWLHHFWGCIIHMQRSIALHDMDLSGIATAMWTAACAQ